MSEMKNGIFDQIRRSASEQWNKVQENLNTPDAKGSILDCILDTLKGVFDKGKEIFSPESIKIALAYTEISKENLSFNDLISLIK